MSASISFKFDASSLPKIDSRGNNYTVWKSGLTVAFRYYGLLKLVLGKESKPNASAGSEAQDDWDKRDNQALMMLLSTVDTDVLTLISVFPTSAEAWMALQGRFDRDTGNSSILLFRSLTSLRYQDGDDLRHHLDEFHRIWTRMTARCHSSDQSVAKALRSVFDSDEVKGSFYLATLPESMDNVVDNLSTQEVTAFQDIETKMLDIAEHHASESVISAAYGTRHSSKGPSSAKPPNSQKECTWCKKHGNGATYIGHLHFECRLLKEYKAQKEQEKAGQNSSKDSSSAQRSKKRSKLSPILPKLETFRL